MFLLQNNYGRLLGDIETWDICVFLIAICMWFGKADMYNWDWDRGHWDIFVGLVEWGSVRSIGMQFWMRQLGQGTW